MPVALKANSLTKKPRPHAPKKSPAVPGCYLLLRAILMRSVRTTHGLPARCTPADR